MSPTAIILIALAGSECIISWIFWVAVFLMLLAMITYVATGDLSWGLRRQPKPPPARATGR